MEIYRRLGIAAKLRNVGLPEDYPNDVSYRTSFSVLLPSGLNVQLDALVRNQVLPGGIRP